MPEKQILPLWKASIVMASCTKRCAVAHCVNQKTALTNWSQNTVSVSNSALVQWSSCLDYIERDTSGSPKPKRRWSWLVPEDPKIAIKAISGRKRLNIQGALDLETFQFTFVEGEKINAQKMWQMLEKLEARNPARKVIHVFLDNARYHHTKILQPWLESSKRRVKLQFLPLYAPHLKPMEHLWGIMHKCVTHNHHYATFNQFSETILGFFRKTLPNK